MIDAIVAIVAVIAGVAGAFFFGTRKGRKAEQTDRAAKQAKADAITHTKAKEARDEVSGMSDDAVRSRLRERANRQRDL